MKTENKDKRKELNPFLKYSGIGMQLLFTILAGLWLGTKIDEYFRNKQPWAAIICSLTFMVVGLVMFIRSLPKV